MHTSTDVAPASREFSTNSFTAETRSTMTWPEVILCTEALSMAEIPILKLFAGKDGVKYDAVYITASSRLACFLATCHVLPRYTRIRKAFWPRSLTANSKTPMPQICHPNINSIERYVLLCAIMLFLHHAASTTLR